MSRNQQVAFLICVAFVLWGVVLLGGLGVALIVAGVLVGALVLTSEF